MAGLLFIRVREFEPAAPQAARLEWVRVAGDRLLSGMTQCGLEDLPRAADNERLVVIVPGTEVLLTRTRLPGANRQKLLRAAPYAVEELLIGDVEAQHVALGERDATGLLPLAVVSRDYLTALLEALETRGLSPQFLLPDYLCLPVNDGAWTVLATAETCYLRQAAQAGFACDSANLAALLGIELDAAETPPARLDLYLADGVDADTLLPPDFRARFPELAVECHELGRQGTGEWLALSLSAGGGPAQTLNLLQGPFARETGWQSRFGPWRAAAAVLALWLVVQVGFDGYRYYQLRQERAALQAQMEQVFRQAFPDSRIVRGRLKAYMAQLVKKMRQGGGGDEFSLAQMLSEVGPALGRSGVTIRSIQYRNGRLDLRLEAKDLASIDRLKQVLAANGKWQVESETTSRGGKVDSVLHIEGKA